MYADIKLCTHIQAFFLSVSYTSTQLVLSPEPHPPAILMGEGSAISARVHWSHTQVGR